MLSLFIDPYGAISPLSMLHKDAPYEEHHACLGVAALNHAGISEALPRGSVDLFRQLILFTQMLHFGKSLAALRRVQDSPDILQAQARYLEESRSFKGHNGIIDAAECDAMIPAAMITPLNSLGQLQMTVLEAMVRLADLSNPTNLWPIAYRQGKACMREFFGAARLEIARHMPVPETRDYRGDPIATVKTTEMGLIQFIVLPYLEALSAFFDRIAPNKSVHGFPETVAYIDALHAQAVKNRASWQNFDTLLREEAEREAEQEREREREGADEAIPAGVGVGAGRMD
ncbi:hypothetical protein KIPB_008300 [Kipferlia bialata]|uniref:PDEase domain-containing protein n=1 Tax=Kipferlia bialata TaxID=797122 RepID=A0A9K3D0E6_9EUKA|nr:hypothetical protein KIPB_008300 [Kipferlia bialata]|eukprot:g8300.t1